MADLNITGDGSDAIAACQAAQAAIDAVQGETVTIDWPRFPGETEDEARERFEDFKRKCMDGTFRRPKSYIRRPHAAAKGFNALDVARAYGLPAGDGAGVTIGIIELGGAYNASDMDAQWTKRNPNITVVNVAGGKPKSDGPNGADGEVALDVQVIAQVALEAAIRVYFCPNTDVGFLAGIVQATAECDLISISWGGPESSWSAASVKRFSAAFAAARAKGVTVFAASGDAGSKDGTKADAVDYPASDPNVIGCGGTRLVLNADWSRKSEVVWNDNPTNDATGGGVSKLFPGRTVPDVAGNADPVTGYTIVVDGHAGVIGGTSAVAPLYAGMCAVLRQRRGRGASFDLLNLLAANPSLAWDVTSGNNGGYMATAGKDDVSGWGVVDFGKLDVVLGQAGTPAPPPAPQPVPAPSPDATLLKGLRVDINAISAKLKAAGY